MVLNKVHDIQINREVTVSNFEVISKLVDVDNHDEDVDIAFGDRYMWSVRKVSDRIFLCEHLMDYNLARLHEPTLNLSAHA